MFYMDWTYVILVLPAVIFAMTASAAVNSAFNKYSTVISSRGMTGSDAARAVLDSGGVYGVRIERVSGSLTDHFDPRDGTIYLSDNVFDNPSCAAIGVAAHEAGHAIQHDREYLPLKIRNAIVPITNIGSKLAVPLIIAGILLSYYSEVFANIAYIGLICFTLSVFFQLITLPTEFNASRRALAAIEGSNILTPDELVGAKKVLSAAAMTYVAALAVSLMQLLRFILLVNRGRNRRN